MIAAALLACAVNVSPVTLSAVVGVESGGDAAAIFDNTTRRSIHPGNLDAAVALASRLVAAGHVIDAGLTQVDSKNWPALGLDVRRIFDPCTNIRAGATILTADYAAAVQMWGPGQEALKHALAAYNTGSFYRGAAYVARYYRQPLLPAVSVHVVEASLSNNRAAVLRPRWSPELVARLTASSSVYNPMKIALR